MVTRTSGGLLGNRPIIVKVLIAPGLIIALMSIMAVLAISTMISQRASFESFARVQYSQAKLTAAIVTDLTRMEGELYHMLSLKGTSDDPAPVQRVAADVQKISQHVATLVDQLAASELDAAQRPVVADLKKALEAYVADATNVVTIGAADLGTGVIMMSKASDSYDTLSKATDRVQALAEESGMTGLANSRSSSSTALTSYEILLGIALFLAVTVTLIVGRAISRPVAALTGAMLRLSDGDTAIEVQGDGRKDEIGAMARALVTLRGGAIEAQRLAVAEHEAQRLKAERQERLEALTSRFDQTMGTVLTEVSNAVASMSENAQEMGRMTVTTDQLARVTAGASDQASASVQSMASAATELSASIVEISRQVDHSTKITGRAVAEATETSAIVRELTEAAQRIGDVSHLIADIASRTNLLALNATIEAARAGEAGKGFAVVASEVKALANQTAQATGEIGTQINAIRTATSQTATAMDRIGTTLNEVNGIAASVAAAVEEQGAATQEIARSAQQAAGGTHQVTESIAEVSRVSADARGVSGASVNAADFLAGQARRLTEEVERFLKDVHAA